MYKRQPEVQANITVRKSTTALQRELSDGYVLGNLVDPGAVSYTHLLRMWRRTIIEMGKTSNQE